MGIWAEGERTEFKREVGDGAVKAVVAFANTEGGTLYIGVGDDGSPVGLEDPDGELTKLTSMLRDRVRPDVLMGVSCGIEEVGGAPVIAVRVARGSSRPYHLASKGPRPEGVFVRSGASSVPASEAAILAMVRESAGWRFEAAESLEQSLTFSHAEGEFSRLGLALGAAELRTLGARRPDGLYTNLGLLLSDQCPPMVKSAAFADAARTEFAAREEHTGSILAQLSAAYTFADARNGLSTAFDGLSREDRRDVPPVALREALVNAVAHREYALSGPVLVSVTPGSVEVVSPGGLPAGIEEEDLSAHISVPRNPALAAVLFRLGLIEAYGTGLGRIRASYAGTGSEPAFRVTPNTFTAMLPNVNAGGAALEGGGPEGEVLALLAAGPKTRAEVQKALGAPQSTTIALLARMRAAGLVARIGGGRSTRYALPGAGRDGK